MGVFQSGVKMMHRTKSVVVQFCYVSSKWQWRAHPIPQLSLIMLWLTCFETVSSTPVVGIFALLPFHVRVLYSRLSSLSIFVLQCHSLCCFSCFWLVVLFTLCFSQRLMLYVVGLATSFSYKCFFVFSIHSWFAFLGSAQFGTITVCPVTSCSHQITLEPICVLFCWIYLLAHLHQQVSICGSTLERFRSYLVDAFSIKPHLSCVKEIEAWKLFNFSNVNKKKTKVMVFGSFTCLRIKWVVFLIL